jgi:hypothetical protein
MRLFSLVLVCACVAVSAASRLGSDAVVHDDRKLQEVKSVVWIVEIILEEGAKMIDPDTATCKKSGDTIPFFDFVKLTAVKEANDFLMKFSNPSPLSTTQVVWELGEVEDVITSRDVFDRSVLERDQGNRALLPGFKFTFIGTCTLCGNDDGDGRRLGSSRGVKQTLTNKVAKGIMNGMKSKCGIKNVLSVSFSPETLP